MNRAKKISKRIIVAFTAVFLIIFLLASSGIARCHQKAASDCNGRVRTVIVNWGIVCNYQCAAP